jgi:multidrug transporter EmrE-like cation transporter
MNVSMACIISSVLCSAGGHFALKVGALRLQVSNTSAVLVAGFGINKWLLLGTALHALALILWVAGLKRVELSVAYPFVALGFVLVALLSWLFLNEPITPGRLIGLLLIGSGVIVISLS